MLKFLIIPCSAVIVFLLCPQLHAQQLQFHTFDDGNSLRFHYRWKDLQQTEHQLNTRVSKSLAYKHFSNFRRYSPEMAQHHIAHALRGNRPAMARDGILLSINQQGASMQYQLSGGSAGEQQKWLQKLQQVRTQALENYIEDIDHIQFSGFQNQAMVKPDHQKIATVSRESLVPFASAMREKIPAYLSKRRQIEYLLHFVQSIPYDPLIRRQHNSQIAFVPPMSLLQQNLGDCDSKATLFISLVRLFYPRTSLALVILPTHALVAIGLPATGQELTVQSELGQLLLLEVAGPALLSPGRVGTLTGRNIEKGQYQLEMIPATELIALSQAP